MKKQIFFLLSMVVLFNVSCKKFLMEDPKGQIDNSNFYQTDADAIAAIDGVYEKMKADITNGIPPIYLPEMISDDGTMSASASQVLERIELDNMIYNSQHGIINTVWTNAYSSIDRANNVLQYVNDSTKIKPSLIRRIHGEAKFLRAFHNFRLVQLFGDIPLMTRVSSVVEGNLYPTRTPVAKVYEAIIEDLKYAELNLDSAYAYTNTKNGGRATMVAAKALLGKVYLTMAGYPLNDVSKYQLAEAKLSEIIVDKAKYNVDLNPTYSAIFTNVVATKALDKERIFYRRGTSSLASTLHAFTRMGQAYRSFKLAAPSRDFSPYTFTQPFNAYVPLDAGTRVSTVEVDDAISSAIPIGFDFKFNNVVYNNLFISSNGFISFNSGLTSNAKPSTSLFYTPNGTTLPATLIAPLMADLNGTGGTASYALSGTAPNRALTIEWKNWRYATNNATGATLNFQVVLNENGFIQFNYDPIVAITATAYNIGFRFNATSFRTLRRATTTPFAWGVYSSNSAYTSNNPSSTIVKNTDNTTTSLIYDQNLRSVYEPGDLRRAVNVDALGSLIIKYIDSGNDASDDFIWLRYSDVLLMYAEAKIAIGGSTNLDDALAIINTIRTTHGGTAIPAYSSYSSQNDLMEKLRLERRRELAFEAHRWYDLKRWNILVPAIKGHLAYQFSRSLSYYDEIVTDKAYLLPIPFADITNNPNLTQNPGYN